MNPAALDAYFTFLYVPSPDTIFTNAYKLEPGEKLVLERGAISKQKYWKLHYRVDPSWTLSDAAEQYRDLLLDAVRLQRVSDVPIGALLSGGVDSSSIVACLSQLTSAPIRTFTVGFGNPRYDELRYARIVAKRFGTEHIETSLEPKFAEIIPELPRYFGEPFADSSALPTWLVSQVARSQVTVALAGDGGDELFAGYTWTHTTQRAERYRPLPLWMRRTVDALLQLAPRHPEVARIRRFSKDLFQSTLHVFRRKHTCFGAEMRARLFKPDTTKAVLTSSVDYFQRHWDAFPELTPQDKMLYHDTVMYLPDDILTKVDRMSMAQALEVRVPILDHRIVEFAASLPFNFKYRNGKSKVIVKHALNRVLPPEVVRQRKQGFALPIHDWFRNELKDHFCDAVLTADSRSQAFLNTTYAQRLFKLHIENRENYGHHLWTILMFEHWLRYMENAVSIKPELSLG